MLGLEVTVRSSTPQPSPHSSKGEPARAEPVLSPSTQSLQSFYGPTPQPLAEPPGPACPLPAPSSRFLRSCHTGLCFCPSPHLPFNSVKVLIKTPFPLPPSVSFASWGGPSQPHQQTCPHSERGASLPHIRSCCCLYL